VAIHAIGDLAVTNALESIAAARRQFPGDHRDRLEHVQLYRPRDLSLFHDLEVVASVQPVFIPTDWAPADKRWGPQRCRYAYAWKSLLQAGLRVQFGSDAPVETINPIYGIHAAVTRQTVLGEPPGGWFPEQKLGLEDSINGLRRWRPGPPGVRISWVPLQRANGRILPFLTRIFSVSRRTTGRMSKQK